MYLVWAQLHFGPKFLNLWLWIRKTCGRILYRCFRLCWHFFCKWCSYLCCLRYHYWIINQSSDQLVQLSKWIFSAIRIMPGYLWRWKSNNFCMWWWQSGKWWWMFWNLLSLKVLSMYKLWLWTFVLYLYQSEYRSIFDKYWEWKWIKQNYFFLYFFSSST